MVPPPPADSVTCPVVLLLALMAPPTTMLPGLAVAVRVKLPAVDAPTVTLLALSLMNTLPPLVVLRLGALVNILALEPPMFPVWDESDRVPVAAMFVEAACVMLAMPLFASDTLKLTVPPPILLLTFMLPPLVLVKVTVPVPVTVLAIVMPTGFELFASVRLKLVPLKTPATVTVEPRVARLEVR